MKREALEGSKFNRLLVIRRADDGSRWLCLCDCGKETEVYSWRLKSGHTKSCGCLWADVCRKHGHGHDADGKQTRTYKAWVNMRSRVNGATPSFQRNYADRGIFVCDRWLTFENFLEDMGEAPIGLSLERIDNDGPYCLDNCCWATPKEQTINRRITHFVFVDGSKFCLKDACKILNLNYPTIYSRVQHGMLPQEAIERPIAPRNWLRSKA